MCHADREQGCTSVLFRFAHSHVELLTRTLQANQIKAIFGELIVISCYVNPRQTQERQCSNAAAHIEPATVSALSLSLSLSLSLFALSLYEFRFCNRPKLLPIVLVATACRVLSPLWRFVSKFLPVAWLMNIANWRQIIPVGTPRHASPPLLLPKVFFEAIWKIHFNSFIFFCWFLFLSLRLFTTRIPLLISGKRVMYALWPTHTPAHTHTHTETLG